MPQSLVQNYVHIVFSTKHREPFLKAPEQRKEMHSYLAGTCKNLGAAPILAGGVEDHVHILCNYMKGMTIEDFLRDLKKESSKWIKTRFAELQDFYWQLGYGFFSVSPSHVPHLKKYILNQVEHHQKESFQEEYRRLLKIYQVEYDERYVWD